jgi:hypothetical protein
MAYTFSGMAQRLFLDVRFQKRTRFVCDTASGGTSVTVESVVVDGTVRATQFNGNEIETGVSGLVFTGGFESCPPNIATVLENAKAAYQIGKDAVVNAFVARYGWFAYEDYLFPGDGITSHTPAIPLFAGYENGCDRSYDIEGRYVTGAPSIVTSPGSVYVFTYNQNCRTAAYASAGSVAVNSGGQYNGSLTWDITSSTSIQVVRACNPDPCTGAPPPPPPPPPPGMGACCKRDGTCEITTPMDCYNSPDWFEFLNGQPCESCAGGRGGCANCGQDGGL